MRLAPFLALAAAAASADPVDFTPKDESGDTLVVTEEQRIEGKIRYEAVKGKSKADFGKRKADFLEVKRFQYDQDTTTVSDEGTVRERSFAAATKEELEEDGKTKKKTQYPHHERKVKVAKGKEGIAVFIEGEPPEDGLQEQGWMDIAPNLLPKQPLAVGKEYEIDAAAVLKAWSRGGYDDKTASGTGKGKYQETVTLDKRKCAKLYVTLTMKGEGKALPTLEVALQGFVHYALDAKKIVKVELAGPVTMKMRVKDAPDIGDVDLTVSGTMKETMTAEIFGR